MWSNSIALLNHREMMEESVSDLRSTMCELQERLHGVDGEGMCPIDLKLIDMNVTRDTISLMSGNEWKTRYETQIDLNGQLKRQISLIRKRLEDLRGNPMGKFIF